MNFARRCGLASLGLLCLVVSGIAQEEELLTGGREPLETRIVERDWALRLRLEASVTDDREDLLREDPAYRAVAHRIQAYELRTIASGGATVSVWSEQWDTRQDLGSYRRGAAVSVPLVGSWYTRIRLSHWEQENDANRHYWYYGVGGFLYRGIFVFSEYSRESVKGFPMCQGYSQYVSGSVHPHLHLGVTVSGREGYDDRNTWSGSGFATLLVHPDWTTVRLDGSVGGGRGITDYSEITLVCYQKVTDRLIVKPSFRHYADDADRESQAFGLTLLAYLSSALDVQCGYRYYSQNRGGDFDTFTAGLSLVF